MTNIHHLHQPGKIMDEASEWLVKVDRGLSKEEESTLQAWLAGHPQHVEVFMQAAALWDKIDSLARLADLFPQQAPKRRSSASTAWALAASLLLVVTAVTWVSTQSNPRSPAQANLAEAPQAQVFETVVGMPSTFDLPDGSQLILNTNSRVTTSFTENERALVLERGELHVRVAHDKKRPFKVFVGNKMVQAVGTEFNLEITSDQRIELIVTEGKVLVGVQSPTRTIAFSEPLAEADTLSSAEVDQPRLVTAGKRVVLSDADEQIEPIASEEIAVKLSWRGGNLVFNGESLAEAISEVERYTSVEFVIIDEDLKKIRVAGRFKAGDVEGLLTTLKQNFNVAYERIGDEKIILTGN